MILIDVSLELNLLREKGEVKNIIGNCRTVFESTQLCGLTGVDCSLVVPLVQYERELERLVAVVASWLSGYGGYSGYGDYRFESRSCRFFLFSFLAEQVEFQQNFYNSTSSAYILCKLIFPPLTLMTPSVMIAVTEPIHVCKPIIH